MNNGMNHAQFARYCQKARARGEEIVIIDSSYHVDKTAFLARLEREDLKKREE